MTTEPKKWHHNHSTHNFKDEEGVFLGEGYLNALERRASDAESALATAEKRNEQLVADAVSWLTIGRENDEMREALASDRGRTGMTTPGERFTAYLESLHNETTFEEAQAAVFDLACADLGVLEAKLAASEAEAKQSAIDTDFWTQQAADIAKERNEWFSKAEASEATVARLTAALEDQSRRLVRLGNEADDETRDAADIVERLADRIHLAVVANDDALASARSQAEETDDQVPPNSPAPLPGTSAQAGRTPRTRL